MKKIILVLVTLLIGNSLYSQLWISWNHVETSAEENTNIIKFDPADSYVYSMTRTTEHGVSGILVSKYDQVSGVRVWEYRAPDRFIYASPFKMMEVTGNYVYAVADNGSILQLKKFTGGLRWLLEPDPINLYDIKVDLSDNLFVLGLKFTGGGPSWIIRKFNSTGTMEWETVITGSNPEDRPAYFQITESGNLYVTGVVGQKVFLVKLDSGGNVLWSSPDGNYTGFSSKRIGLSVSSPEEYIYVSRDDGTTLTVDRFDTYGNIDWSVNYVRPAGSTWMFDGIKSSVLNYGSLSLMINRSGPGYSWGFSVFNYSLSGALNWMTETDTMSGIDMKVNQFNELYILGASYVDPQFTINKYSSDGSLQWIYNTGLRWRSLSEMPGYRYDNLLLDNSGSVFAGVTNRDSPSPLLFSSRTVKYTDYSSSSGRLKRDEIVPLDFTLSQNYPNPFNPSTKIAFTIPSDDKVNITVFNSAGQKVTELINEHLTAGAHEVSFDGSKLGSGVYFYRLSATEFTDTRKMILVK